MSTCRQLLAMMALSCAVPAGTASPRQPAAPVVVGAGILSVGEVYRGSFSDAGNTLYFFTKVGAGERYRIVVSRRVSGAWTTPTPVDLGGDFSDLYPSISRDGARLVFSSYRPIPGASGPRPSAHLWYTDRRGDGWGPPVFMAEASTPGHYHAWVEFGFDGQVYFRRTTPDWNTTVSLRTRWNGRTYSTPEPFEAAERWKGWRADVAIVGGSPGPDGQTVFLDVATRNPRTGQGASDIWVSRKRGDTWSEPAPLGAGVNTDGYDVFPFFSPDGRDLYFVRDFSTFYQIGLDQALGSIGAGPHAR